VSSSIIISACPGGIWLSEEFSPVCFEDSVYNILNVSYHEFPLDAG
jgi:hypothetical protein